MEGFLDQCILVSAIHLVVHFAGDFCLGGTTQGDLIMVYFTGFNLKGVFAGDVCFGGNIQGGRDT